MIYMDNIVQDPKICDGETTIKGKRVTPRILLAILTAMAAIST